MNLKNIILAIILYVFLSLSSVFMKYASLESILIYKGLFYCASMMTLGVFALLWQKLLKKFDLSKVYIFKSATIIYGMLFGYFLFNETINIQMIIGSLITIVGVCIVITEGKHE